MAELIVAMLIIGVIIIALIGIQLSAMVTISNATKRQQATAFANQAMETMRALPWDTLTKGNVPGFHSAGGNADPYYAGTNSAGTVTVDGETYTVRLAVTNPQNTSEPRQPLFDSTGSNLMVMADPVRDGVTYNVRSYIVNSLEGTAGSVGMLVIASWKGSGAGQSYDLALRSSAYPGSNGCGNTAELPYLVSCQDRYTFTSSSGFVSTSLSAALQESADAVSIVPGGSVQGFTVRSAHVTAGAESVQVTNVEGRTRRGGVIDQRMSGVEYRDGFAEVVTAATNNYAVSNGLPTDDTAVIPAGATTMRTVTGTGWSVSGRSDDGRTGSSRSSTTQACQGTQLFAGSPCSYTAVSGSSDFYTALTSGGSTVYPMLRGGAAASAAGGGRFTASSPAAAYGCQSLTSSGCTSGRGEFKENSLQLGSFSTGAWDEGPSTLVEIANYSDSVMVQRGVSQTAAAASTARNAVVRFWDGSATQTVAIDGNSSGVVATSGEVTWNPGGGVSVTASAAVSVTPVSSQSLGETPVVECKTDACSISATAGSITVSIEYRVTAGTEQWVIYQSTVISGSAAGASFERRVS